MTISQYSVASRTNFDEADLRLYVALAIYVFYSNDAFVFISNVVGIPVITTILYSITYIALILIFIRTLKLNITHLVNVPSLIALYAIMVISVTWSIDRNATLNAVLPMVLSSLLCFYIGSTLSLRGIIIFFGVGSGIVVLIDILAVIAFPAARGDALSPWPDAWRGLHNQKNALGETSSFALLACSYLAWMFGGRIRALLIALSLLSAFLLYQSDSRSAQIVTLGIMLLGFSGVLARHNLKRWLALVAFGSICLILIAYAAFVTGLAADVFIALDRKPTMSGRIPIWDVSLGFIDQRPFIGYGHSAFWDDTANRLQSFVRDSQIKHFPYYSHNGFIEIMISFGLLGLITFVLIFIGLIRNIYSILKYRPYATDIIAVSIFVLYFLIANVTEVRIMTRNSLWIVFVALIIRMAALGSIARASQRIAAESIYRQRASGAHSDGRHFAALKLT